jgi:hypothetical protein
VASTYRYLSDPAEPDMVRLWFRQLRETPEEIESRQNLVLYFRQFGSLERLVDGTIDFKTSPIVSMFLPKKRRGALWTTGEVHFNATSLPKTFPELHKVNLRFVEWLRSFERVHPYEAKPDPYEYYLEGSVRNFDSPVFALPSGLAALRREQYFVSEFDTEGRLDAICKCLRLRAVAGIDA